MIADTEAIHEVYRRHAADMGRRFQDLDVAEFIAPVARHLPTEPSDIIDLGAGSGRDAAHFAALGHRVVALEPVAELAAQAANLPRGAPVDWVIDSLPAAAALTGREGRFDLAWLCAVWHHLDDAMREAALARIAQLLRPGGRLILSLRQSAEVDGTLTFDARPEEAIAMAAGHGFSLVHEARAASTQTRNQLARVPWHWLVLDIPGGPAR